MKFQPADRFQAVAMEFAADLDARTVEIRVLTASGKTIALVCARDSILAVRDHIDSFGKACPEIATWGDSPMLGPTGVRLVEHQIAL